MKPNRTLLLIGIAGLALAILAGKKIMSGLRGIRNHNPGNIRLKAGTTWVGQVPPAQQTDPDFVQFSSPVYGIRAMARILQNYAARGLTSVSSIISTWAPPGENDTLAYIRSVASRLNLAPDVPIPSHLQADLIAAIIQHENGQQPYTRDDIERGISLA